LGGPAQRWYQFVLFYGLNSPWAFTVLGWTGWALAQSGHNTDLPNFGPTHQAMAQSSPHGCSELVPPNAT
jgi:hypothetical protein